MARIVKVKFLILVTLLLFSGCKTTSQNKMIITEESSKLINLDTLKDACTSIGFEIDSDNHKQCVQELVNKSDELRIYKKVKNKIIR